LNEVRTKRTLVLKEFANICTETIRVTITMAINDTFKE
jgi:hypothetical protein